MFYDLKSNKLSLSLSCSNFINKVFQIWYTTNIPKTQKLNAVIKLKGLYEKHVSIGKKKTRQTSKQTEHENTFLGILKKL